MTSSLGETIREAQAGDAEAVAQIVGQYSSLIQRECSKFGLWQHPDWSHSDLNQEVLFHVLTQIDQFKSVDSEKPGAAFEQWIRVTTKNFLNNLNRRRKAKKRFPDAPIRGLDDTSQPKIVLQNPPKTASSIFVHDEEAMRLQAAMKQCLDDQGRQVLSLRVVEGLSLKEISERLSLSYDQVRYKFDKSLATLQKQLGEPS